MKFKILFLTFVSVILFSIFNCKKSNTNTTFNPSCSGTIPGFSAKVFPLVQANCNTGGCHNDLGNYAAISAKASDIRSRVVSGNMPKNGNLSSDEKNTIVCWIDGGSPNN